MTPLLSALLGCRRSDDARGRRKDRVELPRARVRSGAGFLFPLIDRLGFGLRVIAGKLSSSTATRARTSHHSKSCEDPYAPTARKLAAGAFSLAAGFILSFALLPCTTYVPPGPVWGLVTWGFSPDCQSPAPPCSLTVGDRPLSRGEPDGGFRADGNEGPSPPAQEHRLEAPHANAPLQSQTPGGLEATAIDWEFIAAREGGRRLTGYVVRIRSNRSGVTVAMGVDLGQRSPADIDRLLISEELKSTLKRYATKKGEEARAYLKSHPLILTKMEADAIDKAIRDSIVRSLRRFYNKAVMAREGVLIFEKLPPEAQTVIASVAFQYGPNLKRATPRFWKSVTHQDWEKAAEELEHFGDRYTTRRVSESRLLLEAARSVRASKT